MKKIILLLAFCFTSSISLSVHAMGLHPPLCDTFHPCFTLKIKSAVLLSPTEVKMVITTDHTAWYDFYIRFNGVDVSGYLLRVAENGLDRELIFPHVTDIVSGDYIQICGLATPNRDGYTRCSHVRAIVDQDEMTIAAAALYHPQDSLQDIFDLHLITLLDHDDPATWFRLWNENDTALIAIENSFTLRNGKTFNSWFAHGKIGIDHTGHMPFRAPLTAGDKMKFCTGLHDRCSPIVTVEEYVGLYGCVDSLPPDFPDDSLKGMMIEIKQDLHATQYAYFDDQGCFWKNQAVLYSQAFSVTFSIPADQNRVGWNMVFFASIEPYHYQDYCKTKNTVTHRRCSDIDHMPSEENKFTLREGEVTVTQRGKTIDSISIG